MLHRICGPQPLGDPVWKLLRAMRGREYLFLQFQSNFHEKLPVLIVDRRY